MDLSVVVVTYNSLDTIIQCLDSISDYANESCLEIILVDNCSTDGTFDSIVRKFPSIISFQNATNRGFAAANNKGLRTSKGRFLLLLNPDAFLIDEGIHDALDYIEKNKDVAILGCKITYPNGEIQTSNNAFPNLLTEFIHTSGLARVFSNPKARKALGKHLGRILGRTINEYLRVYWDSDQVRSVDWVTGACMLVRREALEEVGLLDEHFFMYYEDTDWCLRMTKKGWKIVYFPDMNVVHQVGGGAKKVHPLSELERNRSRLHYYNKHTPMSHRILLRLLFICSILVQIVRSVFSPPKRRGFTQVFKLMLSYPFSQYHT